MVRSLQLSWKEIALAALLLLVPLAIPVVTPSDDTRLLYPYGFLCELIPAVLALRLCRRAQPDNVWPWRLLIVFLVCGALEYLVASVVTFHHGILPMSDWITRALSSLGSFAALLALLGASSGRSLRINGLDAALALALCTLRFLAEFSSHGTQLAPWQAYISLLSLIVLAVAAALARTAAREPEGSTAASFLFLYLCLSIVCDLGLNILDTPAFLTPRDLPFDLLVGLAPIGAGLFGLHLLRRPLLAFRPDSAPLLVQSLLPTLLVVITVLLAQIFCPFNSFGCAVLVSALLFGYALRMHSLYQALWQEQRSLIVQAETLHLLATLDPLTGIGNRRSFEAAAENLLLTRPHLPAALLLIDTDHFKRVNDTLGHGRGDALLQNIAKHLNDLLEPIPHTCFGRLGGDEFVALLSGKDASAACQLAEELRRRVEQITLSDALQASVSIGIASAAGSTLTPLLESADTALYSAKVHGRNLVTLASPHTLHPVFSVS